jgi:filamentous hemagglutinin
MMSATQGGKVVANTAKGGVTVEPVVTAKGTVNGAVFKDVNQTAKVGATNEPTLRSCLKK